MRATRRRIGNPAWLGLGLVVGLPALAEAQLFPNRTITRQKQECASEPPFYSTVRRNYFGYYPTCWSKFPNGWGCPCPNPELPNRVAAFNEQPRDPFRPIGGNSDLEGMPGDDAPLPETRGADDSALPAVPNPTGRSPFNAELNPPPETNPTPNTNPRPTTPDPSIPPQTSGTTAPTNRPGASAASSSAANTATPTLGLLEMPPITPPTAPSASESSGNPGAMALAPDATLTSNSNEAAARPNLGALPSSPTPDLMPPVGPGLVGDPSIVPGAPPAQAPQRRGLFGGLFNSSKRKR